MNTEKSLKAIFLGAVFLVPFFSSAAPLLPEELQLRSYLTIGTDAGATPNSTFNPRSFDGKNYANQINVMVFGRYTSGSNVPEMTVNNFVDPFVEHRTVMPFRGANNSTYMIAGGSAFSGNLSRYDFDGNNRVDIGSPHGQSGMEGFDWVDENTIIYASYAGANRKKLYFADVVAEPFAASINTTWNVEGVITTTATQRIRNVRVGDVYSGYAYYGDASQNVNPNFYAIDLATGVETLLGNAGTLTGAGSFGLWTVLERGGYLYVQTTDNGIQVYNMNSATSLGTPYATYSKAELDAITGQPPTDQYYGLDVTSDGSKLLLGGATGRVWEFGQPIVTVTQSGTDVILSWPSSINAIAIQSTSDLSANFADIDPQPSIVPDPDAKLNRATISIGIDGAFFRLRKTP